MNRSDSFFFILSKYYDYQKRNIVFLEISIKFRNINTCRKVTKNIAQYFCELILQTTSFHGTQNHGKTDILKKSRNLSSD